MPADIPKVATNTDVQATKAFIQNPQQGIKFNDSATVASTIIEDATIFAQQSGVDCKNGAIDKETFKFYIANTYSSEISQYYLDNGVEFDSQEKYIASILNTGELITLSLDTDNSNDISKEDLMTALSFADDVDEKYIDSQIGILEYSHNTGREGITLDPESTSGDLSSEELEHLFNILTTGSTEFIKYDKEAYETQLADALRNGTFDKQLKSIFIGKGDIRTQAGAKYREGESNLYSEDADALSRLINHNRTISFIYEDDLNKQN